MSVHYQPGKANVMVDALSRLSMGSIAHVKGGKKELIFYVHGWAGSDVKDKQDLDLVLVDLKKSDSERAIEAFS
ncbi:hypothetical protein MTR67_040250 [Solanum verrucosum]|uniref:Uncharacterized protein n=1 Tax=Solanum verrucosum TaxID=315347 RepID=A0AAF0ZRH6_SOLVR|nr:hypothetical protein MTR67_040250 [Solanum verrucosum]